ncbi:MAG: hypothetical protein NT129_00190 [Candidatus Aenigmarchaeota archaeon]|nr:hypothetical protein [Candidatus Aenigmarchaeota archaeon]
MKGFIRILEAIIASLLLLASLAYFFEPVVKYSKWPDVSESIKAEDALVALYKSGKLEDYVSYSSIDELEYHKNELTNNLSEMLSKTIAFSVEINGRTNPIIYIGCNCTATEINELNNILSPLTFIYKNRVIDIRINKTTINNIDPRTNILFLFMYENLGVDPYKYPIEKFLDSGGTIFMLADLTASQVNDGFLNETFGLKWKSGASSTTGSFYSAGDVNKTSYRIANYYANTSGSSKSDLFNLFNANNISVDNRTIVSITDSYSFVKINQLPRGRTVWFADFSMTNSYIKNLTKAVVMWASGESYKMDYPDNKQIPEFYKNAQYIAADKEPYEINLIFWRVFY